MCSAFRQHIFSTRLFYHWKACTQLSNFYAFANYNVVVGGIMFLDCLCVRACVCACVDFERKYLWNIQRYQQAVNSVINYDLSRIEQKNSRTLVHQQ